jgi:hypothetical protein
MLQPAFDRIQLCRKMNPVADQAGWIIDKLIGHTAAKLMNAWLQSTV